MTTIALTASDIRARCDTDVTNQVIEDYITALNESLSECLTTSYSEGTAKLILALAVCHLVSLNSLNRLTGYKTPNSTSENYQAFDKRTGIGLTGFGQQILQFDVNNCVTNYFNKTVFIRAVGTSNPPVGRRVRRI